MVSTRLNHLPGFREPEAFSPVIFHTGSSSAPIDRPAVDSKPRALPWPTAIYGATASKYIKAEPAALH